MKKTELKLITTLMMLLVVSIMSAQVTSKQIQGTIKQVGGGIMKYNANLTVTADISNVGKDIYEITLARKVTNFKIVDYTYNGIDAKDLGYSFPISYSYKNVVKSNVQFYKSLTTYDVYVEMNGNAYLENPTTLLRRFNIKYKGAYIEAHEGYNTNTEFGSLNLKILSASLKDELYISALANIDKGIDQKIRTDKKINKLKEQIDDLGNSRQDLLKKKSLYQQLTSIDKENNYSSDLENLEEDIKNLIKTEARKEIDNEDKGVTTKEEKEEDNPKIELENKIARDFKEAKKKEKERQKTYQEYINESNKKIEEVNRTFDQAGKKLGNILGNVLSEASENKRLREEKERREYEERQRKKQEDWDKFNNELKVSEANMTLDDLQNKTFATFSGWSYGKLAKFSKYMDNMITLFLLKYDSNYIPSEIANIKSLTSLMIVKDNSDDGIIFDRELKFPKEFSELVLS